MLLLRFLDLIWEIPLSFDWFMAEVKFSILIIHTEVQSDGCAPIVKAFEDGKNHADPWLNASTIAAGIRVPVAVADYLILEAVRESGGKALTVTDESMITWMETVASLEGMFFCPEGAATLSALKTLFDDGSLLRSERILILNTGSGLKYLELVTLASNSKMSN